MNYVPMPELPSWQRWTAPKKREFRKGVAARRWGLKLEDNPWARSIGGRDYHTFEHFWDMGWKACDAELSKGITV